MTLIIVVMDASFYLRYCITLEKFRPASSWQTHHLIPQAVWKENKTFFNSFGMKGKGFGRASWTNG